MLWTAQRKDWPQHDLHPGYASVSSHRLNTHFQFSAGRYTFLIDMNLVIWHLGLQHLCTVSFELAARPVRLIVTARPCHHKDSID